MMKLSQAVVLLATLSRSAVSFHVAPSSASRSSSIMKSSSTDDSFAAFAQELEADETTTTKQSQPQQNMPWQAKLETLLDPRTSLADRQILASELMTDNQNDIRESVVTAVQERKIDPLLTPTGKRLQDGTRAVARQLTNDIIPKVIPSSDGNNKNANDLVEDVFSLLPKIGNRFVKTMQSQAMKQFQEMQSDLADPVNKIPQRLSQQSKFVQTEVSNIFSETPEGLQGPKYTVVETTDEYEIRDYEAYTVASVPMENTHGDFSLSEEMAAGSTAFNALAGYVFGGNADGKNMEMTTPVTTTSLGEMRFYLSPSSTDDSLYPTFPEPLNEVDVDDKDASPKVTLLQIPASRLAVRRFTGFVTDGEVCRQKQTLLEQLDLDGRNADIDVPHGSIVPHVIFQYNPPYTLPVVRRNEIGVPMNNPTNANANDVDEEEWLASSFEEGDDDVSPSDY